MRIIGADSFSGKLTSIDVIPTSFLKDEDMCILKTINIIYHYRYEIESFVAEDIPNVIIPLDNKDGGDNGGRWLLCDQFTNKLYTNELKTNLINPNNSNVIVINDSLTVSPSGSFSNGPITIETDGSIPVVEPPLIVNSVGLVQNLNAQYLNGVPCNRFVLKENYNTYIQNGVDTFTVGLPNIPLNTDYSVYMTISNIVDTSPSIYWAIITDKQIDRFSIRLSGIIDSPNYILSYFVIGAFDDCQQIPEQDTSYLLDVVGRYINNVNQDRFVVNQ